MYPYSLASALFIVRGRLEETVRFQERHAGGGEEDVVQGSGKERQRGRRGDGGGGQRPRGRQEAG